MRSNRVRSLLVTVVALALGGLGWFFLAPTQIGGSTRYMITHGVSMEPMLHTGDLVLIRPADSYRVGQVVAYHSTLLHTLVLHRIVAISHGHYSFKGDNNDFVDPTHPTRALLVGRMWLHIPHGGTVLAWLHRPLVAAVVIGGVAILLLFGGEQKRRRRRRGRQGGSTTQPQRGTATVNSRHLFAICAVGAVLFAALSVFAFLRPTVGTTTVTTPYTQQLSFGYHGPARAGSVYPNGSVSSGQPIYLQLVHRLTLTVAYRLSTTAPNHLHGSIRIRGTLANDSGWSRSFWLGPLTRFSGNHAVASAALDLARLQALTNRVSTQIGLAADGSYTLAVVPEVRLAGQLAGDRLSTTISPALDLALGAGQLTTGAAAPTAGASGSPSAAQTGLVRSTPGSVATTRSGSKKLLHVPIKTVRLIALGGLALFALLALLTGVRARRRTQDPVERINSRYRHLIVPVSSIPTSVEHPPIDVRSIEALAQLAQRSERLILHDHQDDVDNYLIDDQGTLFRFQALRARNGEIHANGSAQHDTVPAAAGVATRTPAADAADAAHSGECRSDGQAGAAPADAQPQTAEAQPQTAQAAHARVPGSAEEEPHAPVIPPLSDASEDANAIHVSSRVTPLVSGPEPWRPPAADYSPWRSRPEVRLGLTLAPLLTLLAWRQVHARRLHRRIAKLEGQRLAQGDRRSPPAPRPAPEPEQEPQRGPGDRRRADRRRNG